MANAPVCNVKGVVVQGLPKLPALQPIPKPTDLPSVIKAITNITNNLNTINIFAKGNYVENKARRTYSTVRVYDPNDASKQTYVDVLQITGLMFTNQATGQTIEWRQ